jgi:hypothetical protein
MLSSGFYALDGAKIITLSLGVWGSRYAPYPMQNTRRVRSRQNVPGLSFLRSGVFRLVVETMIDGTALRV